MNSDFDDWAAELADTPIVCSLHANRQAVALAGLKGDLAFPPDLNRSVFAQCQECVDRPNPAIDMFWNVVPIGGTP